MVRSQLAEAINYAHQLCDSNQQVLDPVLEEPLTAALTAWNQGARNETRELLINALAAARQINLT